VNPNDVEALTLKIDALINDEALRIKLTNNAYKIIENLEFGLIAKRYLDFITK
jgi:glycosyltransferase involved in cell wall biosynthesis